jgi:hypothetical protein
MAGLAMVLPGRLALVADHLVLALADPTIRLGDEPAFVLSWYAVAYAAAAPGGNLAFIRAPGLGPTGELVITDAPKLDRALRPRLRPRSWPMADPDQPSRRATFTRAPIRDGGVAATVTADDVAIEVEWRELGRPIVASGPVGSDPPWDSSTVLFEAGAWAVTVNGSAFAGQTFQNEIWRPWLGRPLSSALVAVAEVFREGAS